MHSFNSCRIGAGLLYTHWNILKVLTHKMFQLLIFYFIINIGLTILFVIPLCACFMQHLEIFAFDFLSGSGDYLDIINYVFPPDRPDLNKMSKKNLLSLVGTIII